MISNIYSCLEGWSENKAQDIMSGGRDAVLIVLRSSSADNVVPKLGGCV